MEIEFGNILTVIFTVSKRSFYLKHTKKMFLQLASRKYCLHRIFMLNTALLVHSENMCEFLLIFIFIFILAEDSCTGVSESEFYYLFLFSAQTFEWNFHKDVITK